MNANEVGMQRIRIQVQNLNYSVPELFLTLTS